MKNARRLVAFSAAALAAAALVGAVTAQAGRSTSDRAEMTKNPPLIGGFYAGRSVKYILTDASQRKDAADLSKATKYKVAYVPRLNRVPEGALAKLYLFTNGVKGPNPFGFQANVLDSVPGNPKYSPLWRVYAVTWGASASARLLKSEAAVLQAKADGDLTFKRTPLVKNSPVVP